MPKSNPPLDIDENAVSWEDVYKRQDTYYHRQSLYKICGYAYKSTPHRFRCV